MARSLSLLTASWPLYALVTLFATSVLARPAPVAVAAPTPATFPHSHPFTRAQPGSAPFIKRASELAGRDNGGSGTFEDPIKYDLVLTHGYAAPDGNWREVYLVNGQTPGPTIYMEEGQWIEMNVRNELSVGMTIHAHGIHQIGTPWHDGVPGVSQYPILPQGNYTHKWQAHDQYGHYWYHAHHRAYYADGVRGHIYIKPAPERERPFAAIVEKDSSATVDALMAAEADTNLVMLYDWSHFTSTERETSYAVTGIDPLCWQSLLINGRGQVTCPPMETISQFATNFTGPLTAYGCALTQGPVFQQPFEGYAQAFNPDMWTVCKNTSTPLEVFETNGAKWMSFDIVNGGSDWILRYAVDGHSMWVYSSDGLYIQPQKVDILEVQIGQRFSVLVKLDQSPGDYTVRVSSASVPQVISGYGVLRYTAQGSASASSTTSAPVVTSTPAPVNPAMNYRGAPINNHTMSNESIMAPWVPTPPPTGPADSTIRLDVGRPSSTVWVLDGKPFESWREQIDPILYTGGPDSNTTFHVKNGSVVDLIVEVPAPLPAHPMHKHFSKAWVLGVGPGTFNYSTVAEAVAANPNLLNFKNPRYGDGYTTPRGPGWLVVRYVVDQPAADFIHCHVNTHHAAGMAVAIAEGFEVLPKLPADLLDDPRAEWIAPPQEEEQVGTFGYAEDYDPKDN